MGVSGDGHVSTGAAGPWTVTFDLQSERWTIFHVEEVIAAGQSRTDLEFLRNSLAAALEGF